jgi:hypothetical protein
MPLPVSKAAAWLAARPVWQIVLLGLALALGIEAITCLLRFGFDLQSTRDTAAAGRFTLGLRIHHGYFGVLALLLCAAVPSKPLRTLLLMAGIGLALSDLAHHFLVLWTVTGDPEFHLRYPPLQ